MNVSRFNGSNYFKNTVNNKSQTSEKTETKKTTDSLPNKFSVNKNSTSFSAELLNASTDASDLYTTYAPSNVSNSNKDGFSNKETADILAKLKAEASTIDYTGMSDGEIYTSIVNRYIKAFDGTISEKALHGATNGFQSQVNDSFDTEIASQFKTKEKFNLAYAEAHGYGGMTPQQIKDKIMEKYQGQLNFSKLTDMFDDLKFTGAVDGDTITTTETMFYNSLLAHNLKNSDFDKARIDLQNVQFDFKFVLDDLMYRTTDGGNASDDIKEKIHSFVDDFIKYVK